MSDAYKRAGVDIDAGERLVKRIKPFAKATSRSGVMAGLGGFGGLFDLKATGYADPVLVSGADGVGTKLRLAIETGEHGTIGADLVAMCVNDVLAHGAEPLFFLDYFATGALDETIAGRVIEGIADACRAAGCALLGGETAEMPGLYAPGDYDLAGFCVGAVEREEILPQQAKAGDVLIALASSGAHANGFSLIRKIVDQSGARLDAPAPFDQSRSLGAALLEPTRIYIRSVLPLARNGKLLGVAHITGGGLTENAPRAIIGELTPRYDAEAVKLPPLFDWLKTAGSLSDDEMRRTFNCGVGCILIVRSDDADDALSELSASGETAWRIGELATV